MLISDEYRGLNEQLHNENSGYGTKAHKYVKALAGIVLASGVRIWPVRTSTVGCAADDTGGWADITTVSGTIWRYGAEPKESFSERERVE